MSLGTVKNMLHTRSSHPGDRRGFTLIELIIAIVVLGLLATLALMGFRATIDRSTDAKQMARTQSVLREARTLYVQKIYQDPTYTWQRAIIDATADLPTFRTNALAEGVSATGGTNLNAATNGWTLEADSGSGVYSSVSSELVFKVQASKLYVASYSEATGKGVFGYVSQESPPVVWAATCSGSSCDAESATLGTPASGAYAPGTTASLLPTLSYSSTAFSLSGTSQVLSATTTGSPTSFSYTGTLPAGVSFSTSTGAFTGPSSFAAQVTQLAAGANHTCALLSTGAVKCWGQQYSGALGDGTNTSSTTPVQVLGLTSGVTAITSGDYHSCALLSTGAMQCWGNGNSGELGNGSINGTAAPVQVIGLTSGVTRIAAGGRHTCAIHSGVLKCWGKNSFGELTDGTTTRSTTPLTINGLGASATDMTAGDAHICAILTTGAAKCWGSNGIGQLGDGTTTNRTTPVQVTGLTSGVTSIAASPDMTTCAVVSGAAKCWGYNGNDWKFGSGNTTNSSTPVQVSGLTSGVSSVVVGYYNGCAVLSAGGVKCWGRGSSGELGNGLQTWTSTPVSVSGVSVVPTAISTGSQFTCAVVSGATKCWGYNGVGAVGDGTTTNRWSPTQTTGLTGNAGYPASITVTATNSGGTASSTVDISLS